EQEGGSMNQTREARSLPLEELIRACGTSSDPQYLEELIRRVHPVIASTVLRTTSRFQETSRSIADDLIQETYLRICAERCRLLRAFQFDAPEAIFGYLKTVAFNATIDYFRGRAAAKRGAHASVHAIETYPEGTLPAAETAGPTAESLERQILLDQIARHLCDVRARPDDRRIFWLYYRHGMTARAIAAIAGIGLTQKGVESTIRRLTYLVRSWMVGARSLTSEGSPGGLRGDRWRSGGPA